MLILEFTLSPTMFLFNEKKGISKLFFCFLISSIKFLFIGLILLFFKKKFLIWLLVNNFGSIPRVKFLNKLQFNNFSNP